MFGDSEYDPSMAYAAASFEEQLEALGRAVEAGKVRQQTVACLRQRWVVQLRPRALYTVHCPCSLWRGTILPLKPSSAGITHDHPAGAACGAEQRDAIWAHVLLPVG